MKKQEEELNQKINSFVELSKSELKSGNIKKGGYTIIVFAKNIMSGGRNISFVYKDITDFNKKIRQHSKKLTSDVEINFELWSFD